MRDVGGEQVEYVEPIRKPDRRYEVDKRFGCWKKRVLAGGLDVEWRVI